MFFWVDAADHIVMTQIILTELLILASNSRRTRTWTSSWSWSSSDVSFLQLNAHTFKLLILSGRQKPTEVKV